MDLLKVVKDGHTLEKLTGDNWNRFHKQLEQTLLLVGKKDAITNASSTHSDQVKAVLYLSVSENYTTLVEEAATAKDAFEKLKSVCAPLSEMKAQRLYNEINSFQMGSDEKVADYFGRFRTFISEYKAAGGSADSLKEEIQRRIIISGMQNRSDFRITLEVILQSMEPDKITLDVLQKRLADTEISLSQLKPADNDRAYYNRPGRQHQQQQRPGQAADIST